MLRRRGLIGWACVRRPKGADGLVEALRALRTTRSSALRERTATINQIRPCLWPGTSGVPGPVQSQAHRGSYRLPATGHRPPAAPVTGEEVTAYALCTPWRRHQFLTDQFQDLTTHLRRLLEPHAPALMGVLRVPSDRRMIPASRSCTYSHDVSLFTSFTVFGRFAACCAFHCATRAR